MFDRSKIETKDVRPLETKGPSMFRCVKCDMMIDRELRDVLGMTCPNGGQHAPEEKAE
jgi:hypothetical protein